MLFNSPEFVLFFGLLVCAYFLIAAKFRWVLLLAASYYFYASWNPWYTFLIVGSTLVDFFAGIKIEEARTARRKKCFLTLSLCSNLSLLFFFKYYGFVAGEWNSWMTENGEGTTLMPIFNVLLPVGISFYTFQTLSYSIDVYRSERKAERHLGLFALFVTFFPQLVAGPIERSSSLLPQLRNLKGFDYLRVREGFQLIYWGLFKKIVVADWLAEYVETVYASPESQGGIPSILATYFFAFQIYFDFSAYSEIARGCAKVFGVDLMTNFKTPYQAKSIQEFWQRWHISLSTWFRDYVYFPLGGSREGLNRTLRNILIVFVVSGIWHGANWTFLIWGGIHGLLLVGYMTSGRLRSLIFSRSTKCIGGRLTRVLSILVTFHLVLLAWVFFRAETLSDALQIFQNFGNIFPIVVGNGEIAAGLTRGTFLFLFLGVTLVTFLESRGRIFKLFASEKTTLRWSVYLLLGFLILTCGHFQPSEFIYFQF
ncbi:MBOAT family protein [Akkermansiaceae bacterium]|nr:MBOAT family protein [Akkermansiaceae bacterium]